MKYIFWVLITVLLFSCSSSSTFEERRTVAKEMLKNKFDIVVDATTEFIKKKHPGAAIVVGVVMSSKCDCITDSLATEFAAEYDLDKLKELQSEPIESLPITIQKILDKNDKSVMNCLKKW
jgi:hypothetical protein